MSSIQSSFQYVNRSLLLGAVPSLAIITISAFLLVHLAKTFAYHYKISSFPAADDGGLFRLFSPKVKNEFITNGQDLIRKGFSKNKNVCRVRTDFTELVVLAPEYAEELRLEDRLSAGKFTEVELMGSLPGFEPFTFISTHRQLARDVITNKLNRTLPLITGCVTEEVADGLLNHWSNETGWHQISPYQTALPMIAQASIRVFLGRELCRRKRWIEINTQYTVIALGAVNSLRPWPRFMLPLVHWFNPGAKASRALLNEARAILRPIYEKRMRELAEGKAPQDTLVWFEELAKGEPYDPTLAQLTFTVAAIHSTSEFLCQVLLDLAKMPEIVQALREELIGVLKKEGWQQTSFDQLRLMDSVMKESQRLKPITRVFNKRVALDNLKLSRGVEIPKGSYMAVSAHNMFDPAVYPDPEKFDAYRFIKRAKDPKHARFSNFSAVSHDHTGFGFGKHSCPGRTYVTLELKIFLAQILLKYDWKLPNGYKPRVFNNGFDSITDVTAQILIRRRKEEIALPA